MSFDFEQFIGKKAILTPKGMEVLPMSFYGEEFVIADEPNENGHVLLDAHGGKLSTFMHFSHIDWEKTLTDN